MGVKEHRKRQYLKRLPKARSRKGGTKVMEEKENKIDQLPVYLKNKKKGKMPENIMPMLATLVNSPLEEEGWLYEVKWDGFRALAYLNNGNVELRSRNNKNFNDKFYPVFDALKAWKINAVVDGEIIVINEKGLPDFSLLQTWRSEADGQLVYYLFDILWLEGFDLMNVPLEERRNILQKIVPESGFIRVSRNFNVKGKEFFDLADKMGLEGIIAKKADSIYKPEVRSKEWLKIKSVKHQEAIICGYTKNENTSKKFSALFLGIYEHGELIPITPVGTGFNMKMQTEILEKLKPLETSVCPFREVPDYNKPSRFRPHPPRAEVTWVKPELVVEITYRTLSPDGSFRHPSFKGIREDKNAREVVREEAVILPEEEHKENVLVKSKIISAGSKSERKTLLNPSDEMQVRKIGAHNLKLTNLSKIFWSEENISKRDVLNYYYQIVPYMLPYMKDRPQTLNRFPNGIHGKSFYQKDITGKAPDWIDTFHYYSKTDQRDKNFLVCTDEASLLYIASLGCIEMNPWSSRKQSPEHPDWCIIDLDPDKPNTFEQVIETAQVCKRVLDDSNIPCYCKTSGSTGIHIYIPLGAKYSYEESKEFGRAFVKIVHAEIPSFTSLERLTANRKGRIYLDFLQNRPQATVAAPYSLRPKPGAPVSMPLHWEEVKKGLKMLDFNIHNAIARLKEEGDLFKGVLGMGIEMQEAMKRMEGLRNK
jgi:bifunctional non-homologous end joining protein LigD